MSSIDPGIAHDVVSFLSSLTSSINQASKERKHPWKIVFSGKTGATLWSLAALAASKERFEDKSMAVSMRKLGKVLERDVLPLVWTRRDDGSYHIHLSGQVYNCADREQLLNCLSGQHSRMQLSQTDEGTDLRQTWHHRIEVKGKFVEHSVTATNNSNSVLTSPQNADFDSLHVLSMLLPAVFESYELNIWLHKEYDFPDTQYTFAQEIGDDENSNLSVWFRGEQSKLRNLVDHLKRVDRKNDIRRQLPMLETRLSTCDYFAKFFIWQPAHSLPRISRRKLEVYRDLADRRF
ncbi:hypothetical protein JCM5350_006514 [Sporobolomyces pararoseus]